MSPRRRRPSADEASRPATRAYAAKRRAASGRSQCKLARPAAVGLRRSCRSITAAAIVIRLTGRRRARSPILPGTNQFVAAGPRRDGSRRHRGNEPRFARDGQLEITFLFFSSTGVQRQLSIEHCRLVFNAGPAAIPPVPGCTWIRAGAVLSPPPCLPLPRRAR